MKTAEEWKQIWLCDTQLIDDLTFEQRLTQRIEAIQLDALQQGRIEGAKWAAKEVITRTACESGSKCCCQKIRNAILSSLDELKEIK